MPISKRLSEGEKGKIELLYKNKYSERKIAEEIGRSKTTVHNFIVGLSSPKKITKAGRKMSLGKRTIRQIWKLAGHDMKTPTEIISELGLNTSTKTVRRYLRRSGFLKYLKMKSKPVLTQDHKVSRLEFAKNYIKWDSRWENVVFCDEKKFNLDGPDGFRYYWHDLRRIPESLSRRVHGGGSVMIWLGFTVNFRPIFRFITSKMNSSGYRSLLTDTLLPFRDEKFPDGLILLQDNAPPHRAKDTLNWLREQNIDTLRFPAYSPDLNPIENLFGIIVRDIYKHNQQYNSISDLKTAIILSLGRLPQDTLKNLANSMHKRLISVILKNGGSTKY